MRYNRGECPGDNQDLRTVFFVKGGVRLKFWVVLLSRVLHKGISRTLYMWVTIEPLQTKTQNRVLERHQLSLKV